MDGSKLVLLAVLLVAASYGATVDYALFTNVQKLYSNSPPSSTYVTVWINNPPLWQPQSKTTNVEIKHRMFVSGDSYGDGICIFNGVRYKPVNSGSWSGTKWFTTKLVKSGSDTPFTNMDLSSLPSRPLWVLQFVFAVTSIDSSGKCPGPTPPTGITVSEANPTSSEPSQQEVFYWDPSFSIAKGGGNMFFPSSNSLSGDWKASVTKMLQKYGGTIKQIIILGSEADVPKADFDYLNSSFRKGVNSVIRVSGTHSTAAGTAKLSKDLLDTIFKPAGASECETFIVVPAPPYSSNYLWTSGLDHYGSPSYRLARAAALARTGPDGSRRCLLLVDPADSSTWDVASTSQYVYSLGMDCTTIRGTTLNCVGGSGMADYGDALKKIYDDTHWPAEVSYLRAIYCPRCLEDLPAGYNSYADRLTALVSTLTDTKVLFTDSDAWIPGSSAQYVWDHNILRHTSGLPDPSKYTLIDGQDFSYDGYLGLKGAYANTEMTGDRYIPYFDVVPDYNSDLSLGGTGVMSWESLYHYFYAKYDTTTCDDRYLVITNANSLELLAMAGGVTGVVSQERGEARKADVYYTASCSTGLGSSGGGGGGGGYVCTAPTLVPPDYPITLKDCTAEPTGRQLPGTAITVKNWIQQFSTGNEMRECCVTATSSKGGTTVESISMPFVDSISRYRGQFTSTAAQGTYSVRIEGTCDTATTSYTNSCTTSFEIGEPPKPELRMRIAPGSSPACGETTTASMLCEEKPYGGVWGPATSVTSWSTTGFVSDTCSPGADSCTGTVETFSDAPNVTVGATCYVAPGTHLADSASASAVISCTGWTCRTRLRILPRGTATCGQTLTSDLSCEYWLGGGVWEPLSPASVTGWTLNGFTSNNCAAGMSECTATLSTSTAQLSYYTNATCRVIGGCAGDVSTANYLSCAESTTGDRIWIVNASCTPECVQSKMIERPHMYEYLLGRLNCPEMLPNSALNCRVSVLNENPAAVNAILNMSLPSGYDSRPVTLAPSAVSSFDLSITGPSAGGAVYEGRIQLRKQGRLEDAHVVPVLASVGNLTATRLQQFAMPEYEGWLLPAALAIMAVSMLVLRGRK